MLAFLANDLGHVVRSLMNRFIKSSIIEKAPTVQKLCKVDVLNQEIQKSYNQIDVGFAAELELKELIGERRVLDFKMECRGMLQTNVSRIHKKSPLTFTLVRNLNSLDPCEIIKNDEDKSWERFKRVLNVLHACNKVDIGK